MNKSNTILKLFVPAAVALLGVWETHATPTITLSLGPAGTQSGSGGEFNVNSISGGPAASAIPFYVAGVTAFGGNSFETFCIEYNQHYSPGGTYYYQISTAAITGGPGASDPVSAGTAYLYSLFASATLSGYDFTPGSGRQASASALQQTIWFLETERNGLPGGPLIANPGTFDSLLIAEFGSVANAMLDVAPTSAHFGINVTAATIGVAALNLGATDDGTWNNQDQLIRTGGGNYRVPDGGNTLMLLGLGLGGMFFPWRTIRGWRAARPGS